MQTEFGHRQLINETGRRISLLLVGPLPYISTNGKLGTVDPGACLAVNGENGASYLFADSVSFPASTRYVQEKLQLPAGFFSEEATRIIADWVRAGALLRKAETPGG